MQIKLTQVANNQTANNQSACKGFNIYIIQIVVTKF